MLNVKLVVRHVTSWVEKDKEAETDRERNKPVFRFCMHYVMPNCITSAHLRVCIFPKTVMATTNGNYHLSCGMMKTKSKCTVVNETNLMIRNSFYSDPY